MAEKMRVLGIDCGTEYTGFGVCDQDGSGKLAYVTAGAIKLQKSDPLPKKLAQVFETLSALIEEHQPDIVAIEEVFYSVNAKSALKLGQVRGVAMLAASSARLSVAEYAPLSIKSAVTGYGKAEKHQVQQMVMRLLQLPAPPEPADVADALAIAICHLHTAGTQRRIAKAAR
jgi:crossover junction endodeoxyribonuclease RuvC